MRQTIIIGLTAVFVLVAFVALILPRVIQFAANVLDGGPAILEEDNIPPQTPVVAAPPTATYSAQLPLTGGGEVEAEIVLVVNGDEQDRQVIDGDGEFKLVAALTDGENLINLYSVDEAGNQSISDRSFNILLDSEPPTINLSQPTDGESVVLRKNQLQTVKGTTEPKAKVTVGGRLTYANADGEFETNYQLSDGENKIKIVATDEAGNQADTEVTVNFSP